MRPKASSPSKIARMECKSALRLGALASGGCGSNAWRTRADPLKTEIVHLYNELIRGHLVCGKLLYCRLWGACSRDFLDRFWGRTQRRLEFFFELALEFSFGEPLTERRECLGVFCIDLSVPGRPSHVLDPPPLSALWPFRLSHFHLHHVLSRTNFRTPTPARFPSPSADPLSAPQCAFSFPLSFPSPPPAGPVPPAPARLPIPARTPLAASLRRS